MTLEERLSLSAQPDQDGNRHFQDGPADQGRVKEQMEKTQKNYYLNEQMRAIKKEMGAEDDATEELNELEKRIEAQKDVQRGHGKGPSKNSKS